MGSLPMLKILLDSLKKQSRPDSPTILQSYQPLLSIYCPERRIVNMTDSQGQTALHVSESVEISTILVKHQASVRIVDIYGSTALHLTRSLDIETLLLRAGADLLARNVEGDIPLHTAARWGLLNVVRELLEYNRTGKRSTCQVQLQSVNLQNQTVVGVAEEALVQCSNASSDRETKCKLNTCLGKTIRYLRYMTRKFARAATEKVENEWARPSEFPDESILQSSEVVHALAPTFTLFPDFPFGAYSQSPSLADSSEIAYGPNMMFDNAATLANSPHHSSFHQT